jgi:hypothetical protein
MMYHTNPFIGPVLMFAIWLVQLLVAFLIYRDAKEQKMLAPVWFILGIVPMFGYLVDVVYLVLREIRAPHKPETPPASL